MPYYILKLYEVLCRINEKIPFNSYLFGRPLKRSCSVLYFAGDNFVIMYYSVNSPKFIMAVFGIHIKIS